MKIDLTNDTVFSFQGPNLCFLGNENDFRKAAESIIELTNTGESLSVDFSLLGFAICENKDVLIRFASKPGSKFLGKFVREDLLIFEMDSRYWERVFKYFVLMSWSKKTYYLNHYEVGLEEFDLDQECNWICSSEF